MKKRRFRQRRAVFTQMTYLVYPPDYDPEAAAKTGKPGYTEHRTFQAAWKKANSLVGRNPGIVGERFRRFADGSSCYDSTFDMTICNRSKTL